MARIPQVRRDPNPHADEKVRGTMRVTSVTPMRAAPPRSILAPRPCWASTRGSRFRPQTRVASPMGRLMRKIQGQPKWSTRYPPRGGPTLRPAYTAMTLMPRARPRSRAGKALVTMAAEVALSRAPPTPWMIRLATSVAPSTDRAAAPEPRVKMSRPAW